MGPIDAPANASLFAYLFTYKRKNVRFGFGHHGFAVEDVRLSRQRDTSPLCCGKRTVDNAKRDPFRFERPSPHVR